MDRDKVSHYKIYFHELNQGDKQFPKKIEKLNQNQN